jgi:hypothetical protein
MYGGETGIGRPSPKQPEPAAKPDGERKEAGKPGDQTKQNTNGRG